MRAFRAVSLRYLSRSVLYYRSLWLKTKHYRKIFYLPNMSAKVNDLINSQEFTFSIEVYSGEKPPPYDKIDKLAIKPAFIAITWHAKSQDMNSLDSAPLKLASHLRSKGTNVVMHLTCDQLKKQYLDKVLKFLKEIGVCNLLVMLGEHYNANGSEFRNSKELISYIRKHENGTYFCIGVVGFPDEPDVDKIKQLKDKIELGVDYIFTQAFVEYETYKEYVRKCKDVGIKIPIIPGIFIYKDYKQLVHVNSVCNIKVSSTFLENFKNSENVSGIDLVKNVALELKAGDGLHHIHFYTLNNLKEAEMLIKDLQKS